MAAGEASWWVGSYPPDGGWPCTLNEMMGRGAQGTEGCCDVTQGLESPLRLLCGDCRGLEE